MREELRSAIDNKNRQAGGATRRVFAKKSTDAQMLAKLVISARDLLEAVERGESGLVLSAKARVLRSDLVLVKSR